MHAVAEKLLDAVVKFDTYQNVRNSGIAGSSLR